MHYLLIALSIISLTYAHPQGRYSYDPNASHNDESEQSSAQDEPIISKQFYIHSAPEENDANKQPKQFTLGRSQKNYRVVFIKAPSASSLSNQLSAQYAPQEEKTHIYVLSQKEHEININDIATPAPTQPSKPEVFFIKYQTQQEAELAQKQIQEQYDALGGSSQITDEGVAPHSSFIGALGSGTNQVQSRPSTSYSLSTRLQ